MEKSNANWKGTGNMETSAYIALSRQSALRRELDVVANNLANMNTTAFKGEKVMFVEHLVKSRGSDGLKPSNLAFTRDVAQYHDTSEGTIKATGNTLDFAVRDDGYFVVQTPDGGGERYTRNGRFNLDPEGQLVTQHGYSVLSDAGAPIFFAPDDTDIHVSSDGTLSTNNGALAKLRVVRFQDQQKLVRQAGGLMDSKDPPQDIDRPMVVQGALEASNVQPIIEITNMIQIQRAYDGVRSFIDREDQRQKEMIQKLSPRAV